MKGAQQDSKVDPFPQWQVTSVFLQGRVGSPGRMGRESDPGTGRRRLAIALSECLDEFAVNATECAVRQDRDSIPGRGKLTSLFYDAFDVG